MKELKTPYIKVKNLETQEFYDFPAIKGASAYDQAVEGGYTGTLEEFQTDMGNSATNATTANNAKVAVENIYYTDESHTETVVDVMDSKYNAYVAKDTEATTALNQLITAGNTSLNTTTTTCTNNLNTTYQGISSAITTQGNTAQSAIATAKTDAITEIGTTKTAAISAVNSAKTDATTAIATDKASAISAISTDKTSALTAISDAKTDATTTIATDKADAISAIETKGEETLASIPEDYTELSEEVSQLNDDLAEINTATSDDIDKVLMVKSVTGGKVTEWKFGEASSGSEKKWVTKSYYTLTEDTGEQNAITLPWTDWDIKNPQNFRVLIKAVTPSLNPIKSSNNQYIICSLNYGARVFRNNFESLKDKITLFQLEQVSVGYDFIADNPNYVCKACELTSLQTTNMSSVNGQGYLYIKGINNITIKTKDSEYFGIGSKFVLEVLE